MEKNYDSARLVEIPTLRGRKAENLGLYLSPSDLLVCLWL